VAEHLQMEAQFLELRTKHPFIIARGGQSDYRTVWVRLRDADGHEGWGEAAPSRFYGETAETVLAALNVYVAGMPADPFDIEETERRWATMLRINASARAALSAALHDLVGKRLGLPVYQPERIRRPEAQAHLAALGPEIMIVVGYGQIIPQSVIDIAPRELRAVRPEQAPGSSRGLRLGPRPRTR